MKKIIFNTLIISVLSSCSVYSTVKVPKTEYSQWKEAKTLKKTELDKNWWKNFDDEKLNKVIELSKENNKDIQIALTHINQARASQSDVLAENLPVVDLAMNAGKSKSSSTLTNRPVIRKYSNNYKAEFDASWEINIFGLEPAERAASALVEKSQEDYNNTLVTLYGDVANSYFNVRKFQMQLSLQSQKTFALEEKLSLQRSLEAAGRVDALQLSQTEVEIASARSLEETYKNNLKQEEYKLNVLVGVNPGELDSIIDDSYTYSIPQKELLLSAPEEVLANRPDVRSAEKNLTYFDALKDVAYTNLFPKISMSGLLGYESGTATNLFDTNSTAWNATGGILAPILNYKKIHADILDSDAKTQEALAVYEKTVISALSDVEGSLAGYKSASSNLDIIKSQFNSSQNEDVLSEDKYNKGLISYLEYVDVKSRKIENEINLEEAKGNYRTQLVRVYKSLGGGW